MINDQCTIENCQRAFSSLLSPHQIEWKNMPFLRSRLWMTSCASWVQLIGLKMVFLCSHLAKSFLSKFIEETQFACWHSAVVSNFNLPPGNENGSRNDINILEQTANCGKTTTLDSSNHLCSRNEIYRVHMSMVIRSTGSITPQSRHGQRRAFSKNYLKFHHVLGLMNQSTT